MNIKADEVCKIVKNARGKYVYSIVEYSFTLVCCPLVSFLLPTSVWCSVLIEDANPFYDPKLLSKRCIDIEINRLLTVWAILYKSSLIELTLFRLTKRRR